MIIGVRRSFSLSLFTAGLLSCAGCMGTMETSHGESRVWSTANSQDGYAKCPQGTTVTGGGFEIKESDLAAGHVPLVTASKPDGNGWRVMCEDATGKWVAACRSWAVCASVLAR
jgi:hypothetical protein